ncbi:MAG: HEAT repeat domain-containing protein [Anaerolineae bacterium]
MATTEFEKALGRVCDVSAPLDPTALFGLSNARRADVALFTQRWTALAVERRREVMTQLGALGSESFEVEFTPLYRAALDDTDAEVRATAISNLWEDDDPVLAPRYIGLLGHDDSAAVRAAAANALGKYMYLAEMEELDPKLAADIRQALLAAARTPQEFTDVRRYAVESLAFLGDDEVRGVIEDAYNAPSESMQASAIRGMGRSLDPYWSGTVLMELSNADPRIRQEAVWASGELELKQAVPTLVDMLEEPNRDLLIGVIQSLGRIGGPIARQALELVAESEDEEIAEEAEDALSELLFNEGEDWLEYEFNAAALAEADDSGMDDLDLTWDYDEE